MGLTGMVEALAELSAQYDEAIQRGPTTVAHSALVAARKRAHVFLLEVVARVIGMHFDPAVPAQVEARGQGLFRALGTAAERRRTARQRIAAAVSARRAAKAVTMQVR